MTSPLLSSPRPARSDVEPRTIDRDTVGILGGGLVGLTCARALDAAGVRVVIFDAGKPGAASPASAGMLGPLFEATESAASIGDADGLGRAGAAAFAAACQSARDLWADHAPALEVESGIDCDYDRSGALILDRDGLHREPLDRSPQERSPTETGGLHERLLARARATGEPVARLDAAAARASVPDLATGLRANLLLPGEHRVDPRRVLRALDRSLKRRGVRRLVGHCVERVEPGSRRVRVVGRSADGTPFAHQVGRLLIAGGAWSGAIDGLPRLPVRPVRGQMLQLEGVDWPFRGSLRGSTFYAVPRRGARLHVGATVEKAGFLPNTTADGLTQLREWLSRVLPGLAENPVSASWAGLRPGTPDHLPILGEHRDAPGCFWATGHYRNGVLLSPWTAARVVDWVLSAPGDSPGTHRRAADRLEALSVNAFAPERF